MISQRDFKWVNEQRKAKNMKPLSREEFSRLGLHDRNKFVDARGFNAVGSQVLGETMLAASDHLRAIRQAVQAKAEVAKPKTRRQEKRDG